MPEWEKVMRGLECCILKDPDDRRDCEKCPYHHPGVITNAPCFNGMMAQARAIIDEDKGKLEAFRTALENRKEYLKGTNGDLSGAMSGTLLLFEEIYEKGDFTNI